MGAVFKISPEIPSSVQKLEATASGFNLGVGATVELWVDNDPLGVFDSPPFKATWQLAAGKHLFRAIVRDSSGNPIATDEVAILVE